MNMIAGKKILGEAGRCHQAEPLASWLMRATL